MKKLFAVLAVAVISFSATSLRADLLGTKVSGSLTFGGGSTNYFDPANGFVPDHFGNSTSANNVTINNDVEFGFKDTLNRDIANFSGTDLVVRDVCLGGFNCTANASFQMKFTDAAFSSFTLINNDLGVTFSFSGKTLTINYPGNFVADNNATATFLVGSVAQTPEPGTMALVGTGLLGVVGTLRRRFAA